LWQCVAKEVNAIDAEDSKNRTSDDRRLLQVLKAVTNPHCSYAKYSTGNATTLRDLPAQANPVVDVRILLVWGRSTSVYLSGLSLYDHRLKLVHCGV